MALTSSSQKCSNSARGSLGWNPTNPGRVLKFWLEGRDLSHLPALSPRVLSNMEEGMRRRSKNGRLWSNSPRGFLGQPKGLLLLLVVSYGPPRACSSLSDLLEELDPLAVFDSPFSALDPMVTPGKHVSLVERGPIFSLPGYGKRNQGAWLSTLPLVSVRARCP